MQYTSAEGVSTRVNEQVTSCLPALPCLCLCLAHTDTGGGPKSEGLVGTPDTGDVLRARGVMFQEHLPPPTPQSETRSHLFLEAGRRLREMRAPPFSLDLPRVGFHALSCKSQVAEKCCNDSSQG